MDPNAASTSAIPTHLLKAAYLVGKIPVRTCQKDARISYTLYIPPKQYCDVHRAKQNGSQQTSGASKASVKALPIVVNVHGTRRDAITCRDSLISFADEHGVAILAPLFPAGLDGPLDLSSYKQLRSKTLQSDVVLLSIIDEVQKIWPGIDTTKFTLVGFSGGAQFVHRFAYFHSERINALLIASPGQVTKLDNEPWPLGVGDVRSVFGGQKLELDALRALRRIHLMAGELDDNATEFQELEQWLAKAKSSAPGAIKETVSADRLGRMDALKSLQQNWHDHAIGCSFEVVPGVAHEYLKIVPAMVAWLEGCLL